MGEIYRYQLVGPPGYSLTDLKTLQNWVLQRRFKTVPGVIDVVGWGGLSKEYHVEVDLPKLAAYNVTLPQVLTAITNSNINVGARTLDLGEQAVNVRGLGLINSPEDINTIVLTQSKGTPVLLKDVAKVEVGAMPRLGIAGRDQHSDVVLGTVLMRRGEKTLDVLKRVQAEVAKINKGGVLPPGVRLEPYYDRSDLIHVTTHTVLHNVVFGVVLVFLIQWIFLGGLRSAIIVAATIPFALFFSVILIVLRGDSANLLSVGAIDFGIIVDSTVIMVENIFRHFQERGRPPSTHRVADGRSRTILLGAVEVSTAIFFAAAIMVAAFLPLFTMQGVEGQIFAPMAKTYGYALSGALLATFTVSPMLSSFLLPATVQEKETLIVRGIRAVYVVLQSIDAIKNIQVAVPGGGPQGGNAYVPLSELASITLQSGASYIYRENNERYLPIKFSVRGRDLGSTVKEAQAKVAERVQLPKGYRLEWSGEFGELEEAQRRLAVIVPLSVLLILGLLYSMFNSLRDSLLALTFIPSAVCGGILALYLTGTNFSVSASVGFISLFGVAVLHGILMLTFYHHLHAAGYERRDALQRAAETRLRPMLMTALSACVGLLPAAMSTGIGSQVQRPLATVVVGGMFFASLLNLLVLPAFWSFVLPTRRQDIRHGRVPLEVAVASGDGYTNSF